MHGVATKKNGLNASKEYKNLIWGSELHFSCSGYGAVEVSGDRFAFITVVMCVMCYVCYVPLYWRLL